MKLKGLFLQIGLSSEKFSRLDEPILRLAFTTESADRESGKEKVLLEMNTKELDNFVGSLKRIQDQLETQ